MADGHTPNYNWVLPENHVNTNLWGGQNNANWQDADAKVHANQTNIAKISPSPGASLTLSKTSPSVAAQINFDNTNNNLPRWSLYVDATAESSGNAASDLTLASYSDTGSFLATPMTFIRATGAVSFSGTATFASSLSCGAALSCKSEVFITASSSSDNALIAFNDSSSVRHGYVGWINGGDTINLSKDGGPNISLSTAGITNNGNTTLAGAVSCNGATTFASTIAVTGAATFTTTGTFGGAVTATGGVNINTATVAEHDITSHVNNKTRWNLRLGTAEAEGGGNGGSNFDLDAYKDDGTYLSTPLAIARASGVITFNGGGSLSYDTTSGSVIRNLAQSSYAQLDVNGNFAISSGTAIKPGGGSWSAPSDARIKNVEGEFTAGLDAVLKLRPVTYTYKAGPSQRFVGLVAQELEQIFPNMVTKRRGLIDGVEVDDLRDVDASSLLYALVNCVKELKAEIEALKAK